MKHHGFHPHPFTTAGAGKKVWRSGLGPAPTGSATSAWGERRQRGPGTGWGWLFAHGKLIENGWNRCENQLPMWKFHHSLWWFFTVWLPMGSNKGLFSNGDADGKHHQITIVNDGWLIHRRVQQHESWLSSTQGRAWVAVGSRVDGRSSVRRRVVVMPCWNNSRSVSDHWALPHHSSWSSR